MRQVTPCAAACSTAGKPAKESSEPSLDAWSQCDPSCLFTAWLGHMLTPTVSSHTCDAPAVSSVETALSVLPSPDYGK